MFVIPLFFSSSYPISPEQVNHCILSFFENFDIYSFIVSSAFDDAIGLAPNLTASFKTPSVPLRPTFPPIPAIGLTIRPIFVIIIISSGKTRIHYLNTIP